MSRRPDHARNDATDEVRMTGVRAVHSLEERYSVASRDGHHRGSIPLDAITLPPDYRGTVGISCSSITQQTILPMRSGGINTTPHPGYHCSVEP